MPRIFSRTFPVPAEAIDANRHVNNIAYVQWMQDIATEHSAAQGWPMERYFAGGTTWVARSHFVEYLKPAFAGDEIAAHTWVAGLRGRSSTRKYLFVRPADAAILARAETVWVYADFTAGTSIPIPDDLRSAFEIIEKDEDVMRALSLTA